MTISEAAGVSVTPFIDFSFELEFDILDGSKTASGGFAPSSKFPTIISLDAQEEVGSGGSARRDDAVVVTDSGEAACESGVMVASVFDFAVDAWVTGRWDKEAVYNKTISVLDKCFSF